MNFEALEPVKDTFTTALTTVKEYVATHAGRAIEWTSQNTAGAGLLLATNLTMMGLFARFLKNVYERMEPAEAYWEGFIKNRTVELISGGMLFAGNYVVNKLAKTELGTLTLLAITVTTLVPTILLGRRWATKKVVTKSERPAPVIPVKPESPKPTTQEPHKTATNPTPTAPVAEHLEQERIQHDQAERQRMELERNQHNQTETQRLEQARTRHDLAESQRMEQERFRHNHALSTRLERTRNQEDLDKRQQLEIARNQNDCLERHTLEQARIQHDQAESQRLEQARNLHDQTAITRLEFKRNQHDLAESKRLEIARTQLDQQERDRLAEERTLYDQQQREIDTLSRDRLDKANNRYNQQAQLRQEDRTKRQSLVPSVDISQLSQQPSSSDPKTPTKTQLEGDNSPDSPRTPTNSVVLSPDIQNWVKALSETPSFKQTAETQPMSSLEFPNSKISFEQKIEFLKLFHTGKERHLTRIAKIESDKDETDLKSTYTEQILLLQMMLAQEIHFKGNNIMEGLVTSWKSSHDFKSFKKTHESLMQDDEDDKTYRTIFESLA